MCGRHGAGLDWPEKKDNFINNVLLIFATIKIWSELCCQSTWGCLPQLSAKFEPWMKHLSVFDMKQQYILKLILLREITLFSTGIISWISCFIVDLLLYVAYLSWCFGNSKMMTECEPKPISMNFGSPRKGTRGGHMLKAWCRIGLARRKRQF